MKEKHPFEKSVEHISTVTYCPTCKSKVNVGVEDGKQYYYPKQQRFIERSELENMRKVLSTLHKKITEMILMNPKEYGLREDFTYIISNVRFNNIGHLEAVAEIPFSGIKHHIGISDENVYNF